jgi:multiple sugar transport system permease protein
VLWIFALYFGLPIIWLLLAPSKTDHQLVTQNPYSFGDFGNYLTAWRNLLEFNNAELLTWIRNSIFYSVSSVVLAVAVSIPAGYALAATRMRYRRLVLMATLIAMITPGAARVIPLFLEMNAAGLTNTAASVILPHAFFPFGMYLAFIHYSGNLPPDLLNAGRVDGASELRLFTAIALPLSRPVLALVGFFSFLSGWSDYFLPYVMLSSDNMYNLPIGIATLISSSGGLNPNNSTASSLAIGRPEVALAGLIAIAPVVIVFLISQRYLTAGFLSGATKE